MRLPDGLDRVAVMGDIPRGPYPPLGFVPLLDAELGNGDYFGLYWPMGREDEEPLVCDMIHDEWSLVPSFSSLNVFVAWLELNDDDRGELEVPDPGFAPHLHQEAKSMLGGSDLEAAIEGLSRACERLPEISDYWFTLASQLRRVGRQREAVAAALRAITSNWVFGMPNPGVRRMLAHPDAKAVFPDDPIFRRIDSLTLRFGGLEENNDYPTLIACVQDYFVREQYVAGLLLLQNHAYMMSKETTAFQDRYGFDLEHWRDDFSERCLELLGDDRQFAG